MHHFHKESPTTARKILEIVPYVMRLIASDMRQNDAPVLPAHFRLLRLLSHHKWTLSSLATKLSVSPPTMSNTITTLEERGWVTRVRSEEDRRMVHIQVTEEGQRILQETYDRAEEHVAGILSSLDPTELEVLDRGLDVLYGALEQAVSIDHSEEEG